MARKGDRGISTAEWALIDHIWGREPMTVTEIANIMGGQTGWAKSTTKTLIARLVAKGYLAVEEGGKAKRYFPAVERQDAVLAETESFVSRLYNGNLGLLVNTLVDQKSLTPQEIEELRAILDRKGEVE